MIILGIETSCDETAAAVIEGQNNSPLPPLNKGGIIRVLSNVVASQIDIHKKYGGVVPEVAAREHVLNILPVVNEALGKARKDAGWNAERRGENTEPHPSPLLSKERVKSSLSPLIRGAKGGIDAIAVTVGPGLITSLIVGVETARSLAYAWGVPVVAVNHIEGHIYANWIGGNNPPLSPFVKGGTTEFPALILTVSGGHNILVLMKGHGKYKIIGETLDDAAGEAFDKAAQMLGLGYPGGPVISAEAAKIKFPPAPFLQKGQVALPRPMINSKDYNFSFSGLKTALLYTLKKDSSWGKRIPEYAHDFQQAVIDVLIHKTIKAARNFKVKTVMLTGGVSANKELRKQMEKKIKILIPNSRFLIPEMEYTTDNAAMIAAAGYFRARENKFTPWQKLKVDPNLEL